MARPKSDIEPRVIRAAHDVFLREGVESASLRAIARAAGTNIGMVYYYFPTKDDLFMAVVEDGYEGMLKKLSDAFDPSHSVEERLLRVFTQVGQLDAGELQIIQIVVREMLNSNERRVRLIERFQRGHIPLILNTMFEGMQTGKIDAGLPVPVAMVCALAVGALPQLMLRVVGDRLPGAETIPRGKELAELLVSIYFQGVGVGERCPHPTPKPKAPISKTAGEV